MSAKQNPEEQSLDIIDRMDKLIDQTEGLLQQTDDFYTELGIERDAAKRYLESDKVPEAERQKVLKELEDWEEEVAAEVRDAVDRFKSQKAPRRSKARIPRMRI